MSTSIGIGNAQKRIVQLTNYEDGLWDILLGLVMLLLSIYPITRELLGPELNLVLFLVALAILVIGLSAARRYISTPRLGYAKQRRTPTTKLLVALMAGLVLLTLGCVIATLLSPGWIPQISSSSTASWISDLAVEIAVMFAMVGLFSLLGYLFGVTRLFVYGWLLGGAYLLSVALTRGQDVSFNLPLAIASGIIIGTGIVLLVRFIRKYPILMEGNDDEQS
jgi:hypothetical protein